MSVSQYESQVKQHGRELERQVKKRGEEEDKAAKAEKAALRYEDEARRSGSAGATKSKLSSADSKRKEANSHRGKAADASQAAGKAQSDLSGAQVKLNKARAEVAKRDADKRGRDDKNAARRRAEEEKRAARERERQDRLREQEVNSLRSELADVRSRQAATVAAPERIKVLFVATSPEDQGALRLDREAREIQQRVRMSEYRDSIDFAWRPATQVIDLLQILNEERPAVVHFSGHGSHAGLAFENADGETTLLSNADLAMLLKSSSAGIRLAVFNTCDSSDQAALACDHVDAAIGMETPIGDEAALVFAGQLYNSLGFGLPLSQAFEQARAQLKLATGSLSGDPQIHTAPWLELEDMYLVAPSEAQAA